MAIWVTGESIHATAVGQAARPTPNPTWEEAGSGHTGHNEPVVAWFDPKNPAKNPNGHCGLGGTGVACPIGLEVRAAE